MLNKMGEGRQLVSVTIGAYGPIIGEINPLSAPMGAVVNGPG